MKRSRSVSGTESKEAMQKDESQPKQVIEEKERTCAENKKVRDLLEPEFTLGDGRSFRYDVDKIYIRQKLADGELGPIVGKREEDGSFDIEPEKYSGEYANEILFSRSLDNLVNEDYEELSRYVVDLKTKEEFRKDAIAIIEDCFPRDEVEKLRKGLQKKELSRHEHGQNYTIRSDNVAFVKLFFESNDVLYDDDDDLADEILRQGFWKLAQIGAQLQDCVSIKLRCPPQGMIAIYPGNTPGYVEHLDNRYDKSLNRWLNFRVLTIILYLNEEEWDVNKDKGEFSYKAMKTQKTISPKGGSVVIFDSRHISHSVISPARNRYAMTLWLVSNDNLDEEHGESTK